MASDSKSHPGSIGRPQPPPLLPRLTLKPPKLVHPCKGRSSVSEPIALFDDLSIQEQPAFQKHIGQSASVAILLSLREIKLKPHPLTFHYTACERRSLFAEMLYGFIGMLCFWCVHANEADTFTVFHRKCITINDMLDETKIGVGICWASD